MIEAIQEALGLPAEALALTWDSLARIGNLSSASVLHVLEDTLRDRPPRPGSYGVPWRWGRASAPSWCCCEADAMTARTSLVLFTVLVGLVGLERLAELVVSKRNAAWSLARGGVETGQAHYP